MKKLLIILLLTYSSSFSMEEMRAIWACPWDMNTPEKVDQVINLATSANFNTIFFECRYRGDALYVPNRTDSRYPNPEPRSPHIGGADGGSFDPLGSLVEKGHRAGLEVHAWVTVYVIANKKTPTGTGHAHYEHPEWLSLSESGKNWDQYGMAWLDPGVPEANDYLYNVFMDIAVNYQVDGIHFDYVRYAGSKMGFNPKAVARYEMETGNIAKDDESFRQWRRDQITNFIARFNTGLATERPDCQFTAAVFASRKNTAFNETLQEWGRWGNEGIVDAIVPMAYSKDTNTVRSQVEDGVSVSGERFLYVGLGLLEETDPTDTTWTGLESKVYASRKAGAEGIAIFSATGLEKRDRWLAKKLVAGPFREIATVPSMPWKGRGLYAGRTNMKIRSGEVNGKLRYSIEMKRGVPKKYAFLYAKEVSGYTAEPVSLSSEAKNSYYVFAGSMPSKDGAQDLMKFLTTKGY